MLMHLPPDSLSLLLPEAKICLQCVFAFCLDTRHTKTYISKSYSYTEQLKRKAGTWGGGGGGIDLERKAQYVLKQFPKRS